MTGRELLRLIQRQNDLDREIRLEGWGGSDPASLYLGDDLLITEAD